MATPSSKPLILLLTLVTLLSFPFPSISDVCPYPCLPPPQIQTPIYPSPPPPQTLTFSPPQNPETSTYFNPPPASQGDFQPPAGGYFTPPAGSGGYFQPPAGSGSVYPAPPPPDRIVPWYPWYSRSPSSSSVGLLLLPPLVLNLVLSGGLVMALMNLVCW